MCLFYNSVAISAPNTFRIRKVDFYTGKTVCVCVRVCISNQSPIAEIPNIAFTINRFLDRTAVRRVLYTSSVGTLEETVSPIKLFASYTPVHKLCKLKFKHGFLFHHR